MKSIFNNKFVIFGRNVRRNLEKKIFFNKACREAAKREKISFEDIGNVTKNISFSYLRALTPEINENNDLYGIACSLKKYAGIKPGISIKASIEHGLYFGDFVWEMDVASSLPCVLTFSQYRINYLSKKTDKKLKAIGPYLYYVKGYLNGDQLKKRKTMLGRNLTFFPAHSSHFEPVDENYTRLCKHLRQLSKDFDTITVCLYWKDYSKYHEIFRKNGFNCVSAGHMFDPRFMSRLKTIIELSSATASNEVGTILGYSVLLNRPHLLLDSSEVNIEGQNYNYNADRGELTDLRREFSKYTGKITKHQKELVNLYWGLDQVKKPSQIKALFYECEQAYCRERDKS